MLSPELKKAIKNLKTEEKEKLLFRLLPKNPDLVNRLEFELLEQGENLEERREKVANSITKYLKYEPYSPGFLMMGMRGLSGDINQHVKTTKDKYGEVSLNLLMLYTCLENHRSFIKKNIKKAVTFQEYVVNRALTIIQKLQKLHPDLHVEFEEDLNAVLGWLHQEIAPNLAAEKHLPKQFEG